MNSVTPPSHPPDIAPAIALYQQHAVAINRYGRWFLIAWLAAMADGRLFLAIATSTVTYQFLAAGERLPLEKLEPFYQRASTRLSRLGQSPLLASSLAFGTTYGFAAAWSQLGGSWAAVTLLSLAVGNGLFFLREVNSRRQMPAPSEATTADQVGPHWDNLTAADPVKRLLAVRSLLHWCLSADDTAAPYLPGTDVTVRSHLSDCLRVMLTHETEPIVRAALIEGLKALHPKPQLPAGQPAMPSLQSKASPVQTPIRQRSVEYVEP